MNYRFYKKNNRAALCVKRIISCIMSLVIMLGLCSINVFAEDNLQNIKGKLNVVLNVPTETMTPYIKAFEKKYPDVSVNYTCYNNYEIEMQKQMTREYYADVCFVPGFVQREDAPDYYKPLDTYDSLCEKYNFVNQGFHIENMMYSIPCTAYIMGIAYNKDVFLQAGVTEIPKSIEDFKDALALISERTNAVPIASGYGLDWIYFNWTTFPYLEMTGDVTYKSRFVHESDPFTSEGTFYRTYKLLYDMIRFGYTEKEPGSLEWYPIAQGINSGSIGCVVVGSWAIHQIKTCGKNSESIAFMPFPNEVEGTQYATILTDYSYAIPVNTKNFKAARAFIDFMVDESGYAIDQDRVSIVKTDPLPQSYGNLSDVIFSTNSDYKDNDYWYYTNLVKGVDPVANESLIRIVEAAYGFTDESFEGIMAEWNTYWEENRLEECETYRREKLQGEKHEENLNAAENVSSAEYETKFSSTEKEYLETTGRIRIGYVNDMAPFSYERDGAFMGLSRELIDELKLKTEIDAEVMRFSNTDECVRALVDGEIDIAAAIPSLKKYTDAVKTSISFFDAQTVLVHHDSVSASQINDKKEVFLAGELNPAVSYIPSERISVRDFASLINMIDNQEADYAISNFYSAEYYTKSEGVEHIEIFPIGNKIDIVFGFSKNVDTRLISICNKVLYGMSDDQIQAALMKHMNPPIKPVTWKKFLETYTLQINLTFLIACSILFFVMFLYSNERYKRRQNQVKESQKYEILSKLMDEYIFEYHVKEKKLILDQKFDDKFGYGKVIQRINGDSLRKPVMLLIQLCDEASNRENFTTDPFELTDKNNEKAWYKLVSYRIEEDKKSDTVLYGKIVDVNEEVIENMKIRSEAEQDALTGVYNRFGFEKIYTEMLERIGDNHSICISVIDMDDFKSINDSFGHLGGDEALKYLAKKLQKICDDRMIASRYGGDEFILAFFDVSMNEVKEKLTEIVKEMNIDFLYGEAKKHISVSIGAYYTSTEKEYRKIFDQADDVLYQVKKKGKNNCKIQMEQS